MERLNKDTVDPVDMVAVTNMAFVMSMDLATSTVPNIEVTTNTHLAMTMVLASMAALEMTVGLGMNTTPEMNTGPREHMDLKADMERVAMSPGVDTALATNIPPRVNTGRVMAETRKVGTASAVATGDMVIKFRRFSVQGYIESSFAEL